MRDYQIAAYEDIERERDSLDLNDNAPWLSLGMKTGSQLRYDCLDKELHGKGYVPPQAKPVRSKTKGRFYVQMKTPSEQFVVDKTWKGIANPIANQEEKRRD